MENPTHFTYIEFKKTEDLAQGDILQPTEELNSIFKTVHPHFLDNKYSAFLVLTQTCDLVRRKYNKHKCKTRYVNIAVIRPLEDVLLYLLNKVCEKAEIKGQTVPGVYLEESKQRAKMLLQRIFNQNEQAFGLFYLHPDAAVKIAVPSVALIQVSIALRASEHYEKILNARCGRLTSEFRDKLGWLIGNLYGRIATTDLSNNTIKGLTQDYLNNFNMLKNLPLWIPRKNCNEAKKHNIQIEEISREEVYSRLCDIPIKTPLEQAIDRILNSVNQTIGGITEDRLDNIKNSLKKDKIFISTLRR